MVLGYTSFKKNLFVPANRQLGSGAAHTFWGSIPGAQGLSRGMVHNIVDARHCERRLGDVGGENDPPFL